LSTTTSNHSIAEKKAFDNEDKMGSTNSKRPAASEEVKYLSPTGLYPSCNWDLKTIRKLIIEKKLAPFYPGREEKDSSELDECPICFMVRPSPARLSTRLGDSSIISISR